jgi:hypothetical protein
MSLEFTFHAAQLQYSNHFYQYFPHSTYLPITRTTLCSPSTDGKEVPHPSFQVSGFTTWFMNVRDLVVPLHCLWSDSGPRCEHLFSDAHLNASTPF